MTEYECHGCGKIYDDEVGMPGKCCGKTIRHLYNPKIDKFEKAEMELAEFIDSELYLPVKAELAGKSITHSLGMRKEGLKSKIYNVLQKLKDNEDEE